MKKENASKERARAWFEELRNRICAEFEGLEREITGTLTKEKPGTFVKKSLIMKSGLLCGPHDGFKHEN